ncbi:MAG TPA: flavin reductase family protein [Anaerolineae bacterium]|nr:flavin reductase family protein [Anaerolineae bacterium]
MEPETFHKLSYGMYVVSSKKGKRFNGQIANTVFQITSKPPMVAVSINKHNLTHDFILESKLFSVSILSVETPMKFIGHFGFKSGREIDKFESVAYKIGATGTPIVLENSIGYLEAEIINSLDMITHVVFMGKVVDAQILKDGEPMTYAYYREIKGGKAPKAAPTYIG